MGASNKILDKILENVDQENHQHFKPYKKDIKMIDPFSKPILKVYVTYTNKWDPAIADMLIEA